MSAVRGVRDTLAAGLMNMQPLYISPPSKIRIAGHHAEMLPDGEGPSGCTQMPGIPRRHKTINHWGTHLVPEAAQQGIQDRMLVIDGLELCTYLWVCREACP